MSSRDTCKCVYYVREIIASAFGAEYEDSESWLEVVAINEPGEALFVGTLEECNQWHEDNYLSYQYP